MMQSPLPTTLMHELSQYALSFMVSFGFRMKPKEVVSEESDEDDDEILNSYEAWFQSLSDPDQWEDQKKARF